MAHAFDVGQPEELALAGLEGLERGADVDGGVEVGGARGFGRFGEGDGFAFSPAVAEQVGGDAEEVTAGVGGVGQSAGVGEEAGVGLLEEVLGDVAAVGDGDEVAEDGAGGGVVEELKLLLGHGRGLGVGSGWGRGEMEGAGEEAAARIIRGGHCQADRANERARGWPPRR